MRAPRAISIVLAALALSSSGCGWIRALPRQLGLTDEEAAEQKQRRKAERASPFPQYLLEAFPDARSVRLDSASPRLSLAAETELTREDPHLRRGPPRFSPDGRLLAYEEADNVGEVRRIVIRRLDGIEIRSVPRARPGITVAGAKASMGSVAPDWPPNPMSWAPSSDAFCYTRQTDLGAWEVMIADLAGVPARIAGPPAIDGSLAWSPTGDRIAYIPATRPEEIWVADPREKSAYSLFRADGRIRSFAWASDSNRIVYAAGEPYSDVFVLPLDPQDGTPLTPFQLTRWAFDDRSPSFSPDGRLVAFYSTFLPTEMLQRGLTQHEAWSLMVIRSDGSDPPAGAILMNRVVATGVSVGSSMPPAWSPDGRWIASVQPRTEDYHAIILVGVDGAQRHELSPDSLTNEDVAVSVDGVLAYRSRREWGDHEVLGLVARGATRTER